MYTQCFQRASDKYLHGILVRYSNPRPLDYNISADVHNHSWPPSLPVRWDRFESYAATGPATSEGYFLRAGRYIFIGDFPVRKCNFNSNCIISILLFPKLICRSYRKHHYSSEIWAHNLPHARKSTNSTTQITDRCRLLEEDANNVRGWNLSWGDVTETQSASGHRQSW